jgi:hypothetical protein
MGGRGSIGLIRGIEGRVENAREIERFIWVKAVVIWKKIYYGNVDCEAVRNSFRGWVCFWRGRLSPLTPP